MTGPIQGTGEIAINIFKMENKVVGKILNRKKWITVALHISVWLIIFLLPYIFTGDQSHGKRKAVVQKSDFRAFDTITDVFWIALFYFNAIILTHRLIYKRKFIYYACSLIILFCVIIVLHNALFYLMYQPDSLSFSRASRHNIIPFLFTIAISTTYKTISDRIESDQLSKERQSENLKTELSFLRSQINPHFLFNVLNNIAALVRMKSNDLEPTVMKLSSLMQYMLYETDEEKVIMKSEAEYLQAYIDLQKQRYGDELTLQVVFDIKEEWQTIEPMLLIPFIENAFKHGGGLMQPPEIYIHLTVDNNQLHLTVKNKFEESEAIKDKTSGIGLANVKRRLALLYPGKHILTIDKKEGSFIISLLLTLN